MVPYTFHSDRATSLLIPSNDEQFKDCSSRIKCVLVGDGAIGKTSLVVSYTTNGYPTEYVPTAFDNYNVVVNVDNQPIRLQLCDTAGQDDFDSLRPLCYPHTDVFLLCFSVVSPSSFTNVADKWIPEIRTHCPDAPLILVGTQSDLRTDVKVLIELANYREQPVSDIEARRLAHRIGAEYYIESSALTQKNLKEVFDQVILSAIRRNHELKRLTLKAKKKSLKKNSQGSCFSFSGNKSDNNTNNNNDRKSSSKCDVSASINNSSKSTSRWKKFCCWL